MVVTQEPGAPERLAYHEHSYIRAAAYRAKRLYPGPVGELIEKELTAWDEFGYKLGGSGLIMRLIDEIMKPQLLKTDGKG